MKITPYNYKKIFNLKNKRLGHNNPTLHYNLILTALYKNFMNFNDVSANRSQLDFICICGSFPMNANMSIYDHKQIPLHQMGERKKCALYKATLSLH